ncbi:methyltransferase [Methylomarinum sp. Ch1-1]|uniref:Ribosomal RNA large subunit methyltransferase G n=1 Tax=Methylomarinum roseum TaxID=3067653 RepID=A0AAU7NSP6_9GAMM|nr:methyltransferase [Methylomarinum sp. Ch1-1]MDP4520022.1 methyltransferase [Methylomarinum sp. Ch1-1]
METLMRAPQGEFTLRRWPIRVNDVLRAWDAADEYLLHELAEEKLEDDANIVILNDSFGALAVALHRYRPLAISDSWLSQQATRSNLDGNGLSQASVTLLNSLQAPEQPIDYLLIKAPKTLALLEYQLINLQPWLNERTQVIVAGMIKNLPPSLWKLMARLVGPVTTSLARKKARLLYARPAPDRKVEDNPYPVRYRLENSSFTLVNHANVFSRDSLDIGTRLLLQHLPDNTDYNDFIDLGCGNGVVGLMLARQNPVACIRFIDESFMAVASARENFIAAFDQQRQAEFITTDCLSGIDDDSADCIVCNPPFHQQHAVGDHIAWQMFKQSRKVLHQGGELRVIGNRHLAYHISLKKLFGNCRLVASNKKFVILSAIKR